MEKEADLIENIAGEGSKLVYEVSYLLLPNVSQEDAPNKAAALKEKIKSLGAEIISDEDPVFIDLAYQMIKVVQTSRQKADQAYFGWIKFEMDGSKIASVKKFLESHADVVRFLIIKTVRENTLLNGKMKLKSEDKAKRDEDMLDEVVEPVEVPKDVVLTEEVAKGADDLVVA